MTRHIVLAFSLVLVVIVAGGAGPCDVILGSAECAVDADCHGTRLCTNDGKCVECKSDHDCDRTEVCSADGACERASSSEGEGSSGGEGEGAQGGEGEGASGGEGEGSSSTCHSACECPAGDACIAGTCETPPGFCQTNNDCPSETTADGCVVETCNGFFCQGTSTGEGEGEGATGGEGEGGGPSCSSACGCPVGEACLNGTCQTSNGICTQDADCPRENNSSTGQCVTEVCLGGFLCEPASTGGEGEGEGEGAPDTCANHINKGASTDGCDCGCGQVDPDCGTGGCSTPGCGSTSLGCQFCWNGNTTTVDCAGAGQ